MTTFAIIKAGGKQHKVQKGDILDVDKIESAKKGKEISFKEVLLVSDEKKTEIGKPFLAGAKVTAKILEPEVKGKKVTIIKFKPKKRYKKKTGFRARYTRVEISKIEG